VARAVHEDGGVDPRAPRVADLRQHAQAGRASHGATDRGDGAGRVTCHHGSLSREIALDAEQRLKSGELQALVATASLELGIDIGDVDLVMQVGSPRSIATFLQRVGRAGHGVERTPKGASSR
jgi:ATP-dependent Lhr-like helicase